ncbi:hypothetical protein [Erythrobacter ani]|uniref:Lipoprotein n=1 Tax=Erythrobacter ani TaxID=2827235 RepID=A0ABS6SMQ3_9SPHN|nr:hypothetical protein [Erythrobacter ani]MBV7266264.1 hypothetical protein [Erythrobacter ani]
MSTSQAPVLYTISLAALFLAGCTENAEEGRVQDCYVESGGERMFFGSPECLSQFETEKFNGYWLVAYETSWFFPTLEDLERGSIEGAYSLNFLDTPSDEVSALLELPREKVFRVSFEGSKSEIPGIYGALAALRGGVVVKHNFTIEEEIRDVPAID